MGVCIIHSHSRFLQFVNSHDFDMENVDLIIIHGLIHLLGFVKAFNLAQT